MEYPLGHFDKGEDVVYGPKRRRVIARNVQKEPPFINIEVNYLRARLVVLF